VIMMGNTLHSHSLQLTIGAGEGEAGGGHVPPPPNSGKRFFSGNFYVKFGHFSGKKHVKLGNFVNYSSKYNKNSGILIIFLGKNPVKFGHFVNFSYIFLGQKCPVPLKLTGLLRLCN